MTYARFIFMAVLACGAASAADFNADQFTADAKAVQARNYKDPGSVQFRDVYVIRSDDKGRETYSLCGEINAKNSYGAYVGYRPFFVYTLASGELRSITELDTSTDPAMKALSARFAVDTCAGKRYPVERIN